MLSEEAKEDERMDTARLAAPRVWIIDPLDGTREYGEGREDWAVHVALVEDGVPTAGAVALPALGLVLSTAATTGGPPGPRAPAGDRQPHPPPGRGPGHLGRAWAPNWWRWAPPEPRPWPSSGARRTSTPTPGASTSGTRPPRWRWPWLPGCTAPGSTGPRCVYNRPDPYLPDLLVCRPEHAAAAMAGAARPDDDGPGGVD